jgi:hypothetical protein
MRRLAVKLLEGARGKGLQSLLVMVSLFISWMTLLKLFQMYLHVQMQMIEKKLSIVIWIQFFAIELESLLINHMVANPWVISGCSKKHRSNGT